MPGGCFPDSRLPPAAAPVDRDQPRFTTWKWGHPGVLLPDPPPDLGEGLVGSDYRSEIFYTSDEQRQVAEDTIADADASGLWPGKVVTKISEAGRFWEAEAEDQDYLQHYPDGKNQFSP